MNRKSLIPTDPANLRKRAEQKLPANEAEPRESPSSEETRHLLHELRVHQIELEMQNEELRRAQEELEAARARYFDLYDLAPVGYLVLSEKGLILEANLRAATLFGVPRADLLKSAVDPLDRSRGPGYLLPAPQPAFQDQRAAGMRTAPAEQGRRPVLGAGRGDRGPGR